MVDEQRDESRLERLDRNEIELLQELRVASAGVQVLLALLLSVPFNNRFAGLSTFERYDYFITLVCMAIAETLLIADVVFGGASSVVVGIVAAVVVSALWFGIPLNRLRKL